MHGQPVIISGNSNRSLADQVAKALGVSVTEADVKRFADGEISVQIKENVRGRDVFVVQSTCTPVNDHIMEVLVLLDALKRASADRVTAVLPYYGYARQDRKCAPRVPITAKLVADLLTAAGANRILAFELHAGQIQGYFNIPVDHLFALNVFYTYLNSGGVPLQDPIVVSPDAGGVERARALAKTMNLGLAIIDKRREKANECVANYVIGDVKGKDCIIIDDIVDTAGSLIQATDALINHGANCVHACIVHPVLSGPAIDRIKNSNTLKTLITTDSVPLGPEKQLDKIKVLSTAELFANAIKRIHDEESVSGLFNVTHKH